MKKVICSIFILCSILVFSQEKKSDSISDTKEIEEIILKSQHKKLYADKLVYTFDEEALKKARYANDLLKTLPELQFDPISNSIKSTKGGTVLFLINGIEAAQIQIRGIRPENVARVEYFDNPPTRWATRADIVVNLITRNPETGYSFGAEASSAVNTILLNGSAYANYTYGRNNIGLEYVYNQREYDDYRIKRIYDYTLNGQHYRSEEDKKDHFRYSDQDITMRYTNALPENYAFQAKMKLSLSDFYSKAKGNSLFTKDAFSEQHETSQNIGRDYTTPIIDLYFSKNFSKKSEISLNIVGSAFTAKSFQVDKEWVSNSGANVFDNDMSLKAKQRNIVGEIAYTHQYKAGKLSAGYRFSYNNVLNHLHNLVGFSEYEVNYLRQYMYTEFAGKKNKWMYRAGLGLTHIRNTGTEASENTWTITPKIILGYQVAKNQSIRLSSSYTPYSPGSSALNINVVQIVPNIVSRGNPYLKSQKYWNNSIYYTLNNKYFDATANLFYNYINDAIYQFYVPDSQFGGYAIAYENTRNAQRFGIQFSGSVKPCGNNILVVKAVVTPASESIKRNNGETIKNEYISNNFIISSEYKSFSVQYEFNFPVYTFNGTYLTRNENSSHLSANYRYKNFTFSSALYWIGVPATYHSKSILGSVVYHSSDAKIYNTKSMLVFGLSYDFAKGKKNDIDRKLNNSTAPATTL